MSLWLAAWFVCPLGSSVVLASVEALGPFVYPSKLQCCTGRRSERAAGEPMAYSLVGMLGLSAWMFDLYLGIGSSVLGPGCLSWPSICDGRSLGKSVAHSEDAEYCPNFVAHFTALAWHQCEGIGEVLQLPRFYCEEQSLEGIICWLVDTFVVYCIHVKHTFEDYITQQTYVQQCNAQSAVLLNCGLHLD